MRFIGIVPARMASTRFPGKPLALIAGKPMLWHVWEAARKALSIEPLFVATADQEIIAWCEEAGLKYIVTSSSCKNGTERCHDAMRQLSCHPDDVVVNIQGDEPTLQPESLDCLARLFNDPGVQIASLCFALEGPLAFLDKNRVKVMKSQDCYAQTFLRRGHVANAWRSFCQHVGVYAYRRDVLARLVKLPPSADLEQLAWMRAGYKIKMAQTPHAAAAVDVPSDIAKAEAILRARGQS